MGQGLIDGHPGADAGELGRREPGRPGHAAGPRPANRAGSFRFAASARGDPTDSKIEARRRRPDACLGRPDPADGAVGAADPRRLRLQCVGGPRPRRGDPPLRHARRGRTKGYQGSPRGPLRVRRVWGLHPEDPRGLRRRARGEERGLVHAGPRLLESLRPGRPAGPRGVAGEGWVVVRGRRRRGGRRQGGRRRRQGGRGTRDGDEAAPRRLGRRARGRRDRGEASSGRTAAPGGGPTTTKKTPRGPPGRARGAGTEPRPRGHVGLRAGHRPVRRRIEGFAAGTAGRRADGRGPRADRGHAAGDCEGAARRAERRGRPGPQGGRGGFVRGHGRREGRQRCETQARKGERGRGTPSPKGRRLARVRGGPLQKGRRRLRRP
mmetsp:Transcript_9181/g.29778  ORF Transcript_9181/g.29778 Transcript_9181/m.29778 type:complete len:379 (+) Transcript_9181:1816-2952(+)